MADPLSAIGGGAAILQLADTILKLERLWSKVKGIREDVQDILATHQTMSCVIDQI